MLLQKAAFSVGGAARADVMRRGRACGPVDGVAGFGVVHIESFEKCRKAAAAFQMFQAGLKHTGPFGQLRNPIPQLHNVQECLDGR